MPKSANSAHLEQPAAIRDNSSRVEALRTEIRNEPNFRPSGDVDGRVLTLSAKNQTNPIPVGRTGAPTVSVGPSAFFDYAAQMHQTNPIPSQRPNKPILGAVSPNEPNSLRSRTKCRVCPPRNCQTKVHPLAPSGCHGVLWA